MVRRCRHPMFKGRHFDQEIIILCVRWYVTYKLSYRDLAAMMLERGIGVAPSTIFRWVQRYVLEFEKRWNRFSRPVGCSWRVDETYISVKGQWCYLYRAVDKRGRTGLPLAPRPRHRRRPGVLPEGTFLSSESPAPQSHA
jgi:transposase-like protein